jgi:hypothetical protein
MRQPAEFLGEPASTSRAGGEASSDGRPVGSGESGQAGLSLDDLILAALEPGPTHIGGLRRRLDNAFDQPEVLAALKRMADRKLVRCVGAVPASAQWRLIDGPGMLDDFRPRLTGGIVGRMAAAQMPAAAPMSSPSCRSGSRTVGRPAEMTKADPVSVLKLDGPGLAEVQALVSDGLPWRYISDRTGKSEHCLRMAFDRDYRARCQP